MGDPLLGVPLHCAAGLYAEAVAVLQVGGGGMYARASVCKSGTINVCCC
jgi:hypothetical protein